MVAGTAGVIFGDFNYKTNPTPTPQPAASQPVEHLFHEYQAQYREPGSRINTFNSSEHFAAVAAAAGATWRLPELVKHLNLAATDANAENMLVLRFCIWTPLVVYDDFVGAWTVIKRWWSGGFYLLWDFLAGPSSLPAGRRRNVLVSRTGSAAAATVAVAGHFSAGHQAGC